MASIFFCIIYWFPLFPSKTLHCWAGDSGDNKANNIDREKKQCLIKEIDTETFPHKYIQYRTQYRKFSGDQPLNSITQRQIKPSGSRQNQLHWHVLARQIKKRRKKWNTPQQYGASLPDTISSLLIAKDLFNHSQILWAEGSCRPNFPVICNQ